MSPLRKYQGYSQEYKRMETTADTIKLLILLGFILGMFLL